jgi:hypothetical protein
VHKRLLGDIPFEDCFISVFKGKVAVITDVFDDWTAAPVTFAFWAPVAEQEDRTQSSAL